MKRKLLIMLSVMAAYAISSCQNEIISEPVGSSDYALTTIEAEVVSVDPDTKTTTDGTKVTWVSGDAINVFFGASESSKFTTQNYGEIAQFTGYINVVTGGGESLTDETSLWGVYPYNSKTICDGSSVTYTLPSIQEAKAGSFADDLFPTIARSQNFYMSFYNVCGGFRFMVSNPDIEKVTIKGNNEEYIAGKARITMEGKPVVTEILEGASELTMNAPDGGYFETGKYYYFVIYPTEFTNGLTITFHKSDSKASYSVSESISISRSNFSNFTNRDENLNFEEIETDIEDESIIFVDEVMKELCVNAFDTNSDGELSYKEAAAVTDLSQMSLTKKTFQTFDEFQYFTNVREIPSYYFRLTRLKSIILPEGLTKIGSNAFESCQLLKSIILPEGFKEIGSNAFDGSGLTEMKMPETITKIGKNALSNCDKLDLHVPNIDTWFGIDLGATYAIDFTYDLYVNGVILSNLIIPNGIERTGVFKNCLSITKVELPENLKTIGAYEFEGCINLTSINIPKNIEEIGEHAISGTGIKSITIPGNLKWIDEGLFSSCKNLETVVIEEGVEGIWVGAFSGCTNLKSITIPESVTSIEDWCFTGCSSLTAIVLPSTLQYMGQGVFENCSSLNAITIPESISTIPWTTFYACSSLTSIVIPESIVKIASGAFEDCISLNSIFLPSSIPPVLDISSYNGGTFAGNNKKIYVPYTAVDDYKTADGWSEYANDIVGYDFENNTIVQ